MTWEKTLLIIKPDAMNRGLLGEVLLRLENRGLRISRIRDAKLDLETAEEHYSDHKGEHYYDDLVEFITSGMVVCAVLEGDNCIAVVRKIMGATDPVKAEPGTVRGDYATGLPENIMHSSDTRENAEREIDLFFGDSQ